MNDIRFETPCKACVFAVYAGHTQVGCKFDRVEKFRARGVGVKEAYDEEKEFYVIEGVCVLNRHRQSPWAMRNPGRVRMQVARDEQALDVDVVMVMEEGHDLADVERTVASLLRQKPLPLKVTVVVNRDGVTPKEVRALLPGDWVAKFVIERAGDGSRIGRGRCIDHAVADSEANYYAVFSPGFVVPDDFVGCLDRAVIDDLERFILLEPNADGQGLVVQTRAHAYYGGNAEAVVEGADAGGEEGLRADTVEEKLRHRVRVEGRHDLVRKVTDVCPSLAG